MRIYCQGIRVFMWVRILVFLLTLYTQQTCKNLIQKGAKTCTHTHTHPVRVCTGCATTTKCIKMKVNSLWKAYIILLMASPRGIVHSRVATVLAYLFMRISFRHFPTHTHTLIYHTVQTHTHTVWRYFLLSLRFGFFSGCWHVNLKRPCKQSKWSKVELL